MNISIERAGERGHVNHGWLDTYFSFSFSVYQNPKRVHFGALRVLNDDTIDGGAGFGTHPHDNMEIITIPLSGVIAHADSTGHAEQLTPGEVQVMSAGSGLTHSEYNHLKDEKTSLFQIWIFPKVRNIPPHYEQRRFDPAERKNTWQLVAGPADKGALPINQDAFLSLGDLDAGQSLPYSAHIAGNGLFLMVIEGEVTFGDVTLNRRDSASVTNETSISIQASSDARLLMIEVPMEW